MKYTAIINTPGCLPDSDQPPPIFDTPREAWAYLLDERREAEDQALESGVQEGGYSGDLNLMECFADGQELGLLDKDGCGQLHAPRPDGGDHDLGQVYSVLAAYEEDRS